MNGKKLKVFIVVTTLMFAIACTSRVEYAPADVELPDSQAININTATASKLEKLPHVGPKTAAAIVSFRENNGPFRRIEYLMQVQGISESRFAEIRHLLKTE